MRIKTCDICCETLTKTGVAVQAQAERSYTSVDLCEVCAVPILKLLQVNHLLEIPTFGSMKSEVE